MAVAKQDLEKIVGQGNVSDDPQTLAAYSRDQSFVESRTPEAVVFVETVEQIQEVVRAANKTLTPIVPYSSGMNLHGATIPDQGGIILNMSRMKNIIKLDEENWHVVIEPGTTYAELQGRLAERGYRIMTPLGVSPDRSVLSSYLERDPVLAAPSFEHGNYLIMDTEIVLPNGDIFRTGSWTSGGDPGAPSGPIRNTIFRLWTAAQGTLGIMTKMVLQIEPLPKEQKIFFIPFDALSEAIEPLQQIQRREIGTECFLLNNFNTAALFSEEWDVPAAFPAEAVSAPSFEQLRSQLPAWLMIICIQGNARRADEKVAYETEALREACDSVSVELLENLPNIPGAPAAVRSLLLRPWTILKKFHYKGSVHDLTFKCPLKSLCLLEEKLQSVCLDSGYSLEQIGGFILPLERARALHCEFDLHCSPEDGAERLRTKQLWLKASEALMNSGAYFDRPYGPWASLVYSRAAQYTHKLRQLKAEMDENNILNPGKLCFS